MTIQRQVFKLILAVGGLFGMAMALNVWAAAEASMGAQPSPRPPLDATLTALALTIGPPTSPPSGYTPPPIPPETVAGPTFTSSGSLPTSTRPSLLVRRTATPSATVTETSTATLPPPTATPWILMATVIVTPATATPWPTYTPYPTYTPLPTAALLPTPTAKPAAGFLLNTPAAQCLTAVVVLLPLLLLALTLLWLIRRGRGLVPYAGLGRPRQGAIHPGRRYARSRWFPF